MTDPEKLKLMEAGHPAPWADFEANEKALEKICGDYDYELAGEARAQLLTAIETDDDGNKEFRSLVEMYKNCTKENRMVIDAVLCYLCGWSLPTLIKESGVTQ